MISRILCYICILVTIYLHANIVNVLVSRLAVHSVLWTSVRSVGKIVRKYWDDAIATINAALLEKLKAKYLVCAGSPARGYKYILLV